MRIGYSHVEHYNIVINCVDKFDSGRLVLKYTVGYSCNNLLVDNNYYSVLCAMIVAIVSKQWNEESLPVENAGKEENDQRH